MKKGFSIIFIITLLSFIGCKNNSERKNEKKEVEMDQLDTPAENVDYDEVPDPAHTSENALDWSGSYHGTTPCADCPGIETTLDLNDNLTYKIKMVYLDRDGAIEEEGTFKWDQDGQRIKLYPENQGNTDLEFFVGENMLFQLDEKGNRVTGELADKYILEKY